MYISTTDTKEWVAGTPVVHHGHPAERPEKHSHNDHTCLSSMIGHIAQKSDLASLLMYCRGLTNVFNIEHFEIFASLRQPFSDVRPVHFINGIELEDRAEQRISASAAAFQEYCLAAAHPKLWTSRSNSETDFVSKLLQDPDNAAREDGEYLFAGIPWHGPSGNAGGLKLLCRARDRQQLREMENVVLKLAFLTPYILEAVANFVADRNKPKKGVLTNREKDVLYQLALGHSTADVAKLLGISVNTVTTHTRKIHEKLQVNNRQQAVMRAINMNLISLD